LSTVSPLAVSMITGSADVIPTLVRLTEDEDLNTAFFRIFQETLTNIIRHAEATKVTVHLQKQRGHLTLHVHDNGRGITEAQITNTKSIGLLGMLCLRLQSLASMGLAGTAVVLLAVLFSLTFLPALLSILGPRVDALRLPFLSPVQSARSRRAWRRLAAAVMAHPWRVLIPVVAVLLLVGSPFLGTGLRSTVWTASSRALTHAGAAREACRPKGAANSGLGGLLATAAGGHQSVTQGRLTYVNLRRVAWG